MIYNVVFIDGEIIWDYTNLTKEEFFDKLWEWTWKDDLWDFIDETYPTEEELISYLNNIFIDDMLFHQWDEDYTTCYVFCVNSQGTVSNYSRSNQDLKDYIINKVLECYQKDDNGCYIKIRKL